VTRYSKFSERSEQQIWEKQSGGLFRSIFVSYESPSYCFLVSIGYFWLEPVTRYSKFSERSEQQIWEKQSGGLFRSIFVSYESPSYCFLVSIGYFWLEPVTRQKTFAFRGPRLKFRVCKTGDRWSTLRFISKSDTQLYGRF
jgi:hypothetical protein